MISEHMISELGNHLWQSTLFTGVVALLTCVLRRNRAAIRYGLWLAASVKFLIPLGVLVAVGSQREWPAVRATAHQLVTAERVAVMAQISEPFAPPLPAAAPHTNFTTQVPPRLASVVFGIWLCGFAVHCLSWRRRWQRLRTALRVASPAPIDLHNEAQKCDARIKILYMPGGNEPGVLGIFKPVLLLPEGIAEHLTAPQFRAILTHELAHVRRRDNLAAAVHMVMESVFWFHPAVWLIEHRLIEERERACDEEVLAAGIDPQDYCEGILSVCRLYLTTPLACVSGVTGGDLRRRLEGIMTHEGAVALNLARKLVLASAGLLAVAAPVVVGVLRSPNASAQAPSSAIPAEWQNLIGTWQGSLSEANRESRMVFRISPEGGKVKAVLYRIDQGGEGTPASSISREGSTVVVTVSSIKGKYEGKLGSDGKAIAGTWAQGTGAPVLLRLVRATPETAWVVPDAAPLPKSMAAGADPVFEVATIKPSQYPGVALKLSPGGLFEASGPTLSLLIKFAYDLHARQIVGGPSWLGAEKYDVTGKPDKPGRPSLPQLKAMIRKLLADRFQLTVRHEKRELPVYAITAAKSGAKLIENDSDPNGVWSGEGISPRRLSYKNMTMSEFAAVLQQAGTIVDRPVVDQTGFGSTRYDFAMRWTPDASQAPGDAGQRPSDAGAPPDLFTAFQEQLGLKLESTKALVDVLVIDRVEKPSAN